MGTQKTISERVSSPTPKFFRKVRRLSLLLISLGAALAAPPLGIPALVTTILATAGTVGTVVSSMATTEEEE